MLLPGIGNHKHGDEDMLITAIVKSVKEITGGEFFPPPNTRRLNLHAPHSYAIHSADGIEAYDKLLQVLCRNKDIAKCYTIPEIRFKLDQIVYEAYCDKIKNDGQVASRAKILLPAKPNRNQTIYRGIDGVTFRRHKRFGNLSLRRSKNVIKDLPAEARRETKYVTDTFATNAICIAIQGPLCKATEQRVHSMCRTVEHAFDFLIGQKDCGYEVIISRPKLVVKDDFLVLSRNELRAGSSITDLKHRELDLDYKFFSEARVRRILSLCCASSMTKIEERLLRAFSWIG